MDKGFFSEFMPHGHCYYWRSDILWTTVISDSLIVLAYFSIPLAIIIMVKKHPELKFNGVLVLFAVFIFGCGITHAISIWNIWHGDYGLQAIAKSVTAAASVLTAITVWKLLPLTSQIRGPEGFEQQKMEILKFYNEEKKELLGTNEELSDNVKKLITELQERNEEITKANNKLKKRSEKLMQSNEELQQFAYIASHDLRSPLRNISGFVQLLSRQYKEKLDEKAFDWISRTVESTEQMQTLINDLLTFSRVETRGETFKKHELSQVLQDVLILLETERKEKNVKITYSELPAIIADRSQMIQLFSNLIGNGIKYCRDESPQVHISYEETENDWMIIFQDNGIGIEETHHKKIFEIFKRLHTEQEYPGTGIGLAVCQRVARRHDGVITVKSKFGEGTTFTVRIPKKEALDAAA